MIFCCILYLKALLLNYEKKFPINQISYYSLASHNIIANIREFVTSYLETNEVSYKKFNSL
jgi:hypothetical protein